jgi:RNA polymerase sigma factor (sigma-70 family)
LPVVPASSFPPLSAERHRLSVSSACHNSPAAADGFTDRQHAAHASLEASFRAERDKLLSYLGRRAGHDAAPDLVQEVFARAAGSAQASRLANPAAFLRRIARNLLIDRARRRAANNVLVFPLEEQRDAACAPQQEWGLEAEDLLRLYQEAVDSLPEKTRRVFLMHRVDEFSYRDIHEDLGISIATVEYHMMKALAHIARRVDAGR